MHAGEDPRTAPRTSLRGYLRIAAFALLCSTIAAGPALSEEAALRHQRLLRQAELDLARGAFAAGARAASEALAIAEADGDDLRRATARMVRANLFLALGDAEAAARDLESAMASQSEAWPPELVEAVQLNLANVRTALGDRAAAARLYTQVFESASLRGDVEGAVRARINRIRARVDEGTSRFDFEEAVGAAQALAGLPDGSSKAWMQVHLGSSCARALERGHTPRAEILVLGSGLLRSALALADAGEMGGTGGSAAGAPRIRAAALGHLAALYAQEGRLQEALDLTGRALLQAARGDVESELFFWHRQAGRFARRLGRRDAAIDAFAQALRVLEANRAALSRNLQLSMSAAEQAAELAQLYRDYVDLLLARARETARPEVRKADLVLARATLEHLKSDELRDYFEDDCVIRYREKLTSVTSAAFDAVVVYPFLLDDRLELLVSAGDELFQVVVAVDRETLASEITRFRQLLEKRATRQYMRPARRLHAWLIEPIESLLERFDPATLVFVPDGLLRTVPMAALHDGERFLIERYALGLTPGLELTDPKPFDASQREALVAGVSDAVEGFAALPNVQREVDLVHEMIGGDRLFNQTFSKRSLVERIEKNRFGVIHIASHARFDESSAGGFLLAHDGRLSFDALADAVATARYREEVLDLVILSACETAEGNERAALGLSGVAVKAGARSALGTLWYVSDEATAEFMVAFYGSLRQPGHSRAQAVREAQMRLLEDPRFRHPYYWSPFLLINSWL